ncbi:SMP-30/gluconolactonase/LRE family protein [Pyruvatibacter sp. HU-CL02332]|uniref:SMP-30/gluconolactonase/LRE family protein n=1 Tax=Pyruvatibacter sp. HU-CL02332 TaxID=3127650 RepID=UPI00310265A1
MPLAVIETRDMEKIGLGIARCEDVVVSKDGKVWASDQASACAEILPDGSLRRVGKAGGAPNGINMDAQGRIIIANFGVYEGEDGPLQRLDVDTGEIESLASEIDGQTLTACNYPIVAKDGTIYCTHSTWANPWPKALDGRTDGFVFRVTPDGAVEKLADGLKFANGCCLDEDESHLYVCQTAGGNVVRYPVLADGRLGAREDYGPVLGTFPTAQADPDNLPTPADMADWPYTDGNGFDVEGNLWVTLPAANKVVAITPQREVVTIAHDPTGEVLNDPTNVTWGGADMKDVYFGSIGTDYVIKARSPVAGMKLIHQR